MPVSIVRRAECLCPERFALEVKCRDIAAGEHRENASAVGGHRRGGVAGIFHHLGRLNVAARVHLHLLPPQYFAGDCIQAIDTASLLIRPGHEDLPVPHNRRAVTRQRYPGLPRDPLRLAGVPLRRKVGRSGFACYRPTKNRPVLRYLLCRRIFPFGICGSLDIIRGGKRSLPRLLAVIPGDSYSLCGHRLFCRGTGRAGRALRSRRTRFPAHA